MRGLSTIARGETRGRYPAPARGRGVAPRRVGVDLSPRSEERIALRVVRLLEERRALGEQELIDAGELAPRLKVERPWIYRNWRRLGGVRLGDGPRAPLRFEYETAVARFRELRDDEGERP